MLDRSTHSTNNARAVSTETLLAVNAIECRYQQQIAVSRLSFNVGVGDLCCLMGPSGCGKTTVLRAIAGLEPIYRGDIMLHKRRISSPHVSTPPEKRNIGMVFQEYALFPHLNVRDNIGFGLHRLHTQKRNNEIEQLMSLTQLDETLAQHYPHELSGGQQQRVALARALAVRPPLLLMDEPFSNLDAHLRRTINLSLRKLMKERGMSAVLVTHDQEEGFAFADHMGVLCNGYLQQWDSAYNLYHVPNNRFVAEFVGQGRFIQGQISKNHSVSTEIGQFKHRRTDTDQYTHGDTVDVLIRPDDILFEKDSSLRCAVQDKVFSGDRILYTLRLNSGATIQSLMPSHLDFNPDAQIGITTDLEHLIIFPRRSS